MIIKNKKLVTSGVVSIALLALVIGLSSVPDVMAPPAPKTIVVDDDGKVGVLPPTTAAECDGDSEDADFDNIQDAVDDADAGDIIIVCPGDYDESVDVDQEEDLSIKGIAKPTVDGDSPAFDITKDGTHLSGFEVTTDNGDCIVIEANDVKINGILTSGCEDNGIDADGDRISIHGSNLSGSDGSGIFCHNCDEAVIKGNVINDNGNDGIRCLSCNNSVIQGNTINGNARDGIDLSRDSDNNLIKGNTANGNGTNGIEVGGDDNTISNNTANDTVGGNGIDLEVLAETNDVTHNTTNDNDEFGIFDESDTEDNTFDKNKCKGNGTDGSDPDELCKPQGFS